MKKNEWFYLIFIYMPLAIVAISAFFSLILFFCSVATREIAHEVFENDLTEENQSTGDLYGTKY